MISQEEQDMLRMAVDEFRPGLYRHYKGNYYVALLVAMHHETRMPMVVYTSMTYGSVNVRPLFGREGDVDGWNDLVTVDTGNGPVAMNRFSYIGPANDTPAVQRC